MSQPYEGRLKVDLNLFNTSQIPDPGPPECQKLCKTVINVAVPEMVFRHPQPGNKSLHMDNPPLAGPGMTVLHILDKPHFLIPAERSSEL